MLQTIQEMTAAELLAATNGKLLFGTADQAVQSISTDSREMGPDCLYVPIVGGRFDGHDFILPAITNGAKGYLTQKEADLPDATFAISVESTEAALLQIAAAYRKKFPVSIVAVTGSVGKTTTKELTAAVLKERFITQKTEGNHNNQIGFPFTIFGLKSDTQAAVVEMGMSGFGEIIGYSRCARPEIAVITNIGTSHIEHLKSQEGILKAKCEIFEGMDSTGVAVLNGDDPYLRTLKGTLKQKAVWFGIEHAGCDVRAEHIRTTPEGTSFAIGTSEFFLPIAGRHNVYNALAAYCVGKQFGLDDGAIAQGFLQYAPDGIRQTVRQREDGVTVITDCYNASPQSVMAALDVLHAHTGSRKIAVLGDMAELGDAAPLYHYETGIYFGKTGADMLVAVGPLSKHTAAGARDFGVPKEQVRQFGQNAQAAKFLKQALKPGDTVLIKGSRCMKMEEIANAI